MTQRVCFCIILLLAALIIGCRKSNPSTDSQSSPTATSSVSIPKTNSGNTAADNPVISESLKQIISRRVGWNPIFPGLYGKQMPDFTVEDITGRVHSLSDYRGKNVMVVMWATWCVPCMQEIPHLKALREVMPPDKLVILAISNEPARIVRDKADAEQINYTVISHQDLLPPPFGSIRALPSAFFINPDGTLKLATEGIVHLGEAKAIILAQ